MVHLPIADMEKHNSTKAKLVYDCISSSTLYSCVVDDGSRSRMNVVFRIGSPADAELEKLFVEKASEESLVGLKGHRYVNMCCVTKSPTS